MTRLTKFGILFAGAVGCLGFFMPVLQVKVLNVEIKPSAFQVVRGLDESLNLVRKNVSKLPQAREGLKRLEEFLVQAKIVVLGLFLPTALLVLFGLIGVLRGRFGRILALFSMVAGVLAIGVWLLMNAGFQEVNSLKYGSKTLATVSTGSGVTMQMLSGVLGLVGGLVALVKPDRGPYG